MYDRFMPTPETRQKTGKENHKPYLPPKVPVIPPIYPKEAELGRRVLEAQAKARSEQQAADRAYERRTGYRPPRQT